MNTITLSGVLTGIFYFLLFFSIVYCMIGYAVYRRSLKKSPSRQYDSRLDQVVFVLTWWKHLK